MLLYICLVLVYRIRVFAIKTELVHGYVIYIGIINVNRDFGE